MNQSRRLLLVLCSLLLSILTGPLATAAAPANAAPETLVFFGTYTGKKSKGIYSSRLNLATGRLSDAQLAAETPSPSFVAVHPSGRFLYAVNEVNQFKDKPAGSVIAYAIDPASGKLSLLNQQTSGGPGPCHVIVDGAGKNVLVANYGGGSVEVVPVGADGKLAEPSTFIQHQGSSVNASRQEAPHAHGIYVDAANKFAFVPDLGLDKVMIYKFDSGSGKLTAGNPAAASIAPGSGPRHFALTPDGKFAYVISEMRCTVTAFSHDPSSGELKELETVSSLPLGQWVSPGYSTAELFVHPSGKFLYGSNRGHDTIVVFAIDGQTGKLSLVQHASTAGKIPRSFGIDPTGRWLLAANQDSDTVVVFQIDQATGSLRPTGQTLAVGAPVSVAFVASR